MTKPLRRIPTLHPVTVEPRKLSAETLEHCRRVMERDAKRKEAE